MDSKSKLKEETDDAADCLNKPDNVYGGKVESDCVFIVGADLKCAETVWANKWLFAVESPVFERMLFGDFLEANKPSGGIRLVDDDPMTMRRFRLLICSNERASRMEAFNLKETVELANFCHKYMAISITKLCIDRLSMLLKTLSVKDVPTMFEVSFLFPNTPFYEDVQQITGHNQYPISEALNHLNEDAFMEYLSCRKIRKLSHLESFKAIDSYLKHNDLIPEHLLDQVKGETEGGLRKRTYLRTLLNNIDFGQITSADFRSVAGSSNILTWEQKYHILSCICEGTKPIILFEN